MESRCVPSAYFPVSASKADPSKYNESINNKKDFCTKKHQRTRHTNREANNIDRNIEETQIDNEKTSEYEFSTIQTVNDGINEKKRNNALSDLEVF